MTPEQKKEILESESFDKFCSSRPCGSCIFLCIFTGIICCADAYYAVKIESEKAKVEKLRHLVKLSIDRIRYHMDAVGAHDIKNKLKEIEG